MSQAEPNLKVTDRRHFTAEGELKADVASEPEDHGAAAYVASSAGAGART